VSPKGRRLKARALAPGVRAPLSRAKDRGGRFAAPRTNASARYPTVEVGRKRLESFAANASRARAGGTLRGARNGRAASRTAQMRREQVARKIGGPAAVDTTCCRHRQAARRPGEGSRTEAASPDTTGPGRSSWLAAPGGRSRVMVTRSQHGCESAVACSSTAERRGRSQHGIDAPRAPIIRHCAKAYVVGSGLAASTSPAASVVASCCARARRVIRFTCPWVGGRSSALS